MTSQDLKAKGNQCFSNHDYTEAIDFYTKAIDLCPSDHTLYSNRSISLSKLGRYEEALVDSDNSIKLKPNFARGYLRKCVALSGLQRYEEVLDPAQEGYKLHGSDAISQGCIKEWVAAVEVIFRQKEMPDEINSMIPPQFLIISEEYLGLVLNLIAARFEYTTTCLPLDLTTAFLLGVIKELNRVLQLFDHKSSPFENEWIDSFGNASKLDPITSKVPLTAVTKLLRTSEQLAAFFHNDVDHVLYPIVSPIISLAVAFVNMRCISLNCVCMDHHVVEITAAACLVFFEKSLLSDPQHVEQHIGMYKEMLEGIASSSRTFSEEEISLYKKYITNLEVLLKNPSCCHEYFELGMVSIGLIKLRLSENPGFDHIAYGFGHGKTISQGKSLEEILTFVDTMGEVIRDMLKIPLDEFTPFGLLENSQSFICCTSGLIRHGEYSKAIEVFKLSEEAFKNILQRQIISESFSLDSGPEVILSMQTIIFTYAKTFLKIDQSIVANTVIRWRCLFFEFRALLMRLGMGEKYMNTFKMIQKMNMQKKDYHNELTISKVADSHQDEVQQMMMIKGMPLLTALLKQTYELVQSVLKPGEIMLEYLSWRSEYKYHESNEEKEPDDLLLVLRKDSAPVIRPVNFKSILAIADGWLSKDKKSKENEMANRKSLCDLLIPADIQTEISSSKVVRMFLSVEPTFMVIPFDLLLLPCGEILGEKCTIVHLSASREIIRNITLESVRSILDMVKSEENADENTEIAEPSPGIMVRHTEVHHGSTVANTSKHQRQCVIFADPSYNLEQKSVNDADMVGKLAEAISALFLKPSEQSGIANPLPKTKVEAQEIEYVIATSQNPLPVKCIFGEAATLSCALQVESPFLLHFSTHGFAEAKTVGVSGTFWDDTKSGLLLAGANTYRKRELTKLVPEAGTGQLSSLAVMGMNLQGTRLVYLSTCISAQGTMSLGESINSLAHAFRAAGAQTVVATLWTVFDDEARMFATHFYYEAFKNGVPPSQALRFAKEKMIESGYHWIYSSSYICIGEDLPLFPVEVQ